MIICRIAMNVLPEKQLELNQTLLSIIESTEKEAGCLSYAVFCDIEDQNNFCLLEEWETRDDLDHHIKSTIFGVFLGSQPLLCEPLHFQIYSISETEGIEAVNSARKNRT